MDARAAAGEALMTSDFSLSNIDFYMPFPPLEANPAVEEAGAATWLWLDEVGICPAAATRRYLRRTQPELVTALYYPHAAPEVVALISQWTAWAFILDDEFDDGPAGSVPSLGAEAIEGIAAVMYGAKPASPLGEALLDLWDRLVVDRSPSWRRTFRNDVSAWLWTYYAESVDRTSGRLPSIDDYQLHRLYSVGMPMYLDMCEIACGIDLPEAVRRLPALKKLRNAACQRIGLYNDLLSARKERAAAYTHNAVFLVEEDTQCTTQEAVERVNNLVTQHVKRVIAFEEQVPDQLEALGADGHLRSVVLRCVAAYRELVRGDHDYATRTRRYMEPEEDQLKEARYVGNLLGAKAETAT
ncbi:terpene synthase family protein [Streptomyces chattanoogensis]|nr:terpene synthase family protein [Streptomyces chattanoogensis]